MQTCMHAVLAQFHLNDDGGNGPLSYPESGSTPAWYVISGR
jgi:hypothetical protein